MAKGKKRRPDAKLRVIAGGAGPKAVVSKPAGAGKSTRPEASGGALPANVRRDRDATKSVDKAASSRGPSSSAIEKLVDKSPANDDALDDAPRVSAVATLPMNRSGLPRALIFGALVLAMAGAVYMLTRKSPVATTPATGVPASATEAPVSVPTPSVAPIATPPSASAAVVESASAMPSASSAPLASVSASASPSVAAPASVAAPPSPATAPKPTVAPPPPKPTAAPPPKAIFDDPYQ